MMLTTTEAAALLTERGDPTKADTVKHWCRRGILPNAKRIGSGRRGYWLIPQDDLNNLTLPLREGRPRKER